MDVVVLSVNFLGEFIMRKKTEQITREDIKSYASQLRCVLFCMKVLMPDLKVAYLTDPWGKKIKIINTYKTKKEKKMDEYEDYISALEAELERIGQEIDKQTEDI